MPSKNPNDTRKDFLVTVNRTYIVYVGYTTTIAAEDMENAEQLSQDLDIPDYPDPAWRVIDCELDNEEQDITEA